MITGGKEAQYDDDDKNAYPTEVIQAAWKVRESETLPALLKKAKDRDKDVKGGSGKGSKAPGFTY